MDIKSIRVAGIYDDLTAGMLAKECILLNLDINEWERQMEAFEPDLLFVESAWSGKDSQWYRKITMKSEELMELVQWCKTRKIPTVFWNKEDPLQFNVFIESEFIFDWVFTTDLDSIPLYKRILKHDRIGVLPFATSLSLFNPLEEFKRKEAVSFAGTYYKNQVQRTKEFEEIYDALKERLPVYIYERNIYPGDPDYRFPEKYREHILASLPIDEVHIAYKKYVFSLTINTIKNSSTMQARRAFELLSSNTLVISNQCSALYNFFGSLITYYDTPSGLYQKIARFLEEEEYLRKVRLAGLRKVIEQHTYQKRLEYVCQKVFKRPVMAKKQSVLVLSVIQTQEEFLRVYACYKRQAYMQKRLVLVVANKKLNIEQEDASVRIVNAEGGERLASLGQADYFAYFSPKNYYGKNFLYDCMQAVLYTDKPVIGKGCYFYIKSGKIEKKDSDSVYSEGHSIVGDRCVIAYQEADLVSIDSLVKHFRSFSKDKCVSIDEYNFCEGFQGTSCETADDLAIDAGYELEQIYQVADALKADPKYYTIQKRLTGKEVLGNIRYHKSMEGEVTISMEENKEEAIIEFGDIKSMRSAVYNAFYDVKEYAREGKVFVYYDGEIEGTAYLKIAFFNSAGGVLVRYHVPPQSYKRFPVPDEAERFTIHLIVMPYSKIRIREIFFNAVPVSGILNTLDL